MHGQKPGDFIPWQLSHDLRNNHGVLRDANLFLSSSKLFIHGVF
jgi:hypothetical protein